MALKDCLDKFGPSITDAQRKSLADSLANGLSDNQAVRIAQLMAHQNVVDIASRVREETGIELTPVSNPVTQLAELQFRQVAEIEARRKEIQDSFRQKQDHFENITDLRAHFQSLVGTEKDLSDDKVLMDAILKFYWVKQKELKAGGAIMGLSGKNQFELLDNFRKLEAYESEIAAEFLDLGQELLQLQLRRDSILEGKGPGPQTFEQGPVGGKPKLMVLHNMNADNLIFTDKMGGLPVPSMSVLPEGAMFSNFGEISFIGTQDMGDPSAVPLLDADGYTVRYPDPVWGTVKQSDARALQEAYINWDILYEGSSNLGVSDLIMEHSRRNPDGHKLFNSIFDSVAARAKYLAEVHGVKFDPRVVENRPKYAWGWDQPVLDFFANAPSVNNLAWEDPKRIAIFKQAAEVVAKAAEANHRKRLKAAGLKGEALEQRLSFIMESVSMTNPDGTLYQTAWDSLRSDIQRMDGETLDIDATGMLAQSAMEGTPGAIEGYNAWVSKQVQSLMGEPKLKINGKLVEYNLENIVRKMKGKLRGQEFMDDQMTMGLMRAQVSHRFKLLEEARARAETNISDEQAVKDARDQVQRDMLNWTSELAQYYIQTNNVTGYTDHFAAADDAMRAIVSWQLGKGMGTAVDFEEALIRNGFPSVPEDLIDQGMMVAMDWMAVPVPYFESKPQRAIKLEEFAGAVIPSDASAETRAILAKRGVPFKEYQVADGFDNRQSRQDAIAEFTQQLDNQGERVLFQSDIGFTSGLLTAAKVMPRENGTAADMLGTLMKQPNVKKDELDSVGVEEWMNAVEAEGRIIKREDLIRFIEGNGVQLQENYYQGEPQRHYSAKFREAHYSDYESFFNDDMDAIQGAVEDGFGIFDVTDRNSSDNNQYTAYIDAGSENAGLWVDDKWVAVEIPSNFRWSRNNAMVEIEDMINDLLNKEAMGDAKGLTRWTEYTLDGNEQSNGMVRSVPFNDREIVLYVPEVGGYNYTMDDLTKSHHPSLFDPGQSSERKAQVQREADLFHYIDALNQPDENGVRFRQIFQIKKSDFPAIEDAMQYIIDEKPVEAPPSKNFDSHAFPEKNIIVWLRVSDRAGPNGKRILHVEENQSDLHQAGLMRGYQYTRAQQFKSLEKSDQLKEKVLQMLSQKAKNEEDSNTWSPVFVMREFLELETGWPSPSAQTIIDSLSKKQRTLMNQYREAYKESEKMQRSGNVPNMPFKGDLWAELGMKRVIRMAVEQGYDQVTWSTGSQQLDVYNLADRFSSIEYDPRSEELTTYDTNGGWDSNINIPIERLAEHIGDEPALEIKKKIDEAKSRWKISPVYLSNKLRSDMTGEELAFADAVNDGAPVKSTDQGKFNLEMSPNDIVLNDDDQFIDDYAKGWIADNGVAFALIDENGEMVRQAGGDYQLYEYYSGADLDLENFAFEDNVPTLSADEFDLQNQGDEEVTGLRKRYDELLVNVTNRALRKLDKSVRVKRQGIQMEGDSAIAQGLKVEREGGGSLRSGIVDPGAFYVEGYADVNNPVKRTQLSPRFDTYDEADAWYVNAVEGFARRQHGFDITPKIIEEVMKGQTLFQGNNRASITFQEKQGAIIRMKDSRDFSSFAHEGAHLYLEIMSDLAAMPDASERLINDYAKVLKYLGVNKREEITRDHHELWARSWEAYLWEGKSPTAELAPLLSTYSGWMRTVYQQIKNLLGPGEELNDEIRGVFDRMLATDEQIKNSEDFMGYVALYSSAEEMGVSQRAYEIYREHMDKAHNEVVDRETQKMIRSMLWAKQKWWKDELKKIEAKVRAEAEGMEVYKALHFLQRGKNPDGTMSQIEPFKISKESLKALMQGSQATLNKMPGKGKYGIYSAKGGLDVDVAANILGFESGMQMIDQIMNAPNMEKFIKDEARTRMQALHPDPLTDPEMMNEITEAVHNEARGRVLAAELRAARKQQKEHAKAVKVALKDMDENERKAQQANAGQLPKREDYAHIKAAAKKVIEAMRFRDINPNKYLNAERKAGRLAFEAMKKKDYETAYAQKRIQIMQYEAYRAAVRAKAKMVKNEKYLRGMEKTAKRKRMGKGGVLEEIDAVLKGINFGRISNKRLDQTPILRELLSSMREAVDNGSIQIPEHVLRSMETPDGVNWREMTVEEFQGVADVVRQYESQADRTYKIKVNGEWVIIKDAAAELAASVAANHDIEAPVVGTKTKAEKLKIASDTVGASLANPGHIAKLLDGLDDNGAFNRLIVMPIRRAVSERLMPMQDKALADIQAIFLKHYTRKELQFFQRKNYAEINGRMYSKDEVLSMALNQGTETNKEAFFGGLDVKGKPAFPPEDVAAALAKLDKRDWTFVQAIWDYNDSYWPAFEAHQKERRGIASDKVESAPFTVKTSDGFTMDMAGGYYHLTYDSVHSDRLQSEEFSDYYQKMGDGVYVSSNTRAGASHNRSKNHGEVVQLGLHVIQNHLREITRDMALGNEINYVKAMLNDPEVRKQLKITGNKHHLDALVLWIADVAVGELPANHVWDSVAAIARTNFTMSRLMFNFRVGFLQFAGITQSAAIIGKKATARGTITYARNPTKATRFAFEKSAFLAGRYERSSMAFDRDISDATERISSGSAGLPTYTKAVAQVIQKYGFAPIYLAQGVTDIVTWTAAYEKALKDKGMSDAESVIYADAQVQLAQTSGLWSDRSNFERGSTSATMRQNRWMRLWATLISFMVSRTVNVYIEQKKLNKDLTFSGIMEYTMNVFLLLVMDALLIAILYQKFDDDDDLEEKILKVAQETGLGMLGGIPGVRDIQSAKYGSGNTAFGTAINDVYHVAEKTGELDFDRKFWRHSIDLLGILTGAPSTFINKTIDVAMSDDPEAWEYVLGKDKNKE